MPRKHHNYDNQSYDDHNYDGLSSVERADIVTRYGHLKLVSEWERGEKRPSGPSLKLLTIVKTKGLQAIA